jgi:SNF2 family DNA or RNA helicase
VDLRPYQEQGADFLFEHDRAMILAPVGAGKTAMTLAAMQDMIEQGIVKRFLVLAPKRVCRDVWPVEQPKWAPRLTMALAIGTPAQRLFAVNADTHVLVTNYDNLQWLSEQDFEFDAVVFDELTRLKNPSGVRFKAFLKRLDDVNIRWGLTGSFTSNGLEDVFGQCKIVDQSLLGRAKGAFLQQYFYLANADYNDWKPREGSLEAVMKRIKPATFVLEPGEYKDQLPPLHTVEMRCDMADRTVYEQMKKDAIAKLAEKDVAALTAAAAINKLQQISSGFIYDESGRAHWVSTHKFDLLDEILTENQNDNTIIVYNYKEELAELQRRYPHAKLVDNNVDKWNKGEIPLLLLHPKSAGHGLNLQHGGNKIIFLSLPWSLELYEQTVGRLHRGGQTRDVWCYVLMTNKTVDERIWASLFDKRAISDVALDELKA